MMETINKTGVVMVSSALFNRQIDAEASQVLSPADLAGLPLCVAKWLECSKVLGKERIHRCVPYPAWKNAYCAR
jgi:hypothetical protein